MKTIGMLGGMSCESTGYYYSAVNKAALERLGGVSSASVLLHSFNFQEIADMQHSGDWAGLAGKMAAAAQGLERSGAECIVICTNTMHVLAPQVEEAVSVPLLHIAEPVAQRARSQGLGTLGLLGTRFTMEQDFIKGKLQEEHGIKVIVPDEAGREAVHGAIYSELVKGVVTEGTRSAVREQVAALQEGGAEGVVLGCTELGMAIKQPESPVPLIDTAEIHAEYVAEWALS